jgi:hypothetical protein
LPIDAKTWSGASGSPTASLGFSRNAVIVWPSAPASTTPNWSACASGARSAATVTAAPVSMCCSTIWRGSIR